MVHSGVRCACVDPVMQTDDAHVAGALKSAVKLPGSISKKLFFFVGFITDRFDITTTMRGVGTKRNICAIRNTHNSHRDTTRRRTMHPLKQWQELIQPRGRAMRRTIICNSFSHATTNTIVRVSGYICVEENGWRGTGYVYKRKTVETGFLAFSV